MGDTFQMKRRHWWGWFFVVVVLVLSWWSIERSQRRARVRAMRAAEIAHQHARDAGRDGR